MPIPFHGITIAVIWYFALQVSAFIVWPLVQRIFECLPDRGRGLSKPLGLLCVGWTSWALALVVGVPAHALQVILVGCFLAWACRLWTPYLQPVPRAWASGHKTFVEAVFALA